MRRVYVLSLMVPMLLGLTYTYARTVESLSTDCVTGETFVANAASGIDCETIAGAPPNPEVWHAEFVESEFNVSAGSWRTINLSAVHDTHPCVSEAAAAFTWTCGPSVVLIRAICTLTRTQAIGTGTEEISAVRLVLNGSTTTREGRDSSEMNLENQSGFIVHHPVATGDTFRVDATQEGSTIDLVVACRASLREAL